jgi:uncharacterized membrane protein (DUF373 family)
VPRDWADIRREWPLLTAYERFEALLAVALRLVIGLVILVAFYRLVVDVLQTVVLRSLNPLDATVFEHVFGEILTLLIALEFNHTLQYVVSDERGVIRAKIVILIALLALSRKVIILDLTQLPPATVVALALLAFSLGVTYYLVRERDAGRTLPRWRRTDRRRVGRDTGRPVSEPDRERQRPAGAP